jgi:hypothetical protein
VEAISTITEFLQTSGARLRFFDMGRRVAQISREQFLQFEKTSIPYPYPLQRQAWFALLFQDKSSQAEPLIWFLRLPLDEQGKLLQAARDDFMHRLIERIGARIQGDNEGQQLESALQDNPYSFKPNDDRMAVFHARISRLLNNPPSRFYAHARHYFSGEPGWDQWSFVGYQGIADLAVRLDQEGNASLVAGALAHLPAQPLIALCHCLENEVLSARLTQGLLNRVKRELQQSSPDSALLAAAIRGSACSRSRKWQHDLLKRILASPGGNHIEILTALCGRAWEQLLDGDIRKLFLERLAENSAGQEAFNLCLADLLYMPGMRQPILTAVRDPNRSAQLSRAIGALFQGFAAKQC